MTQVHTQPGIVARLLEDTRQCVEEILQSDNKNDTVTVCIAFLRGNDQEIFISGSNLWNESKSSGQISR